MNYLLMWHEILSFALLTIWRTENSNSVDNKRDKPKFTKAQAEAVEFSLLVNRKPLNPMLRTINIKWHPPSEASYKLNSDGSCIGNPGVGGIGEVIRNNSKGWVIGYAKKLQYLNQQSN
ncbi:hypothetical protein FXO37_00003 [Capsicum annuum]|nr:hypothetical protein FXO37_00003 [Capsicum annuum]